MPSYYEGRLARLSFALTGRPKLDPGFEEANEGDGLDHKEKLETKRAALEAVVCAAKRSGLVAEDLLKHWDAPGGGGRQGDDCLQELEHQLRTRGYPSGKPEKATQTVLQQADSVCVYWAG